MSIKWSIKVDRVRSQAKWSIKINHFFPMIKIGKNFFFRKKCFLIEKTFFWKKKNVFYNILKNFVERKFEKEREILFFVYPQVSRDRWGSKTWNYSVFILIKINYSKIGTTWFIAQNQVYNFICWDGRVFRVSECTKFHLK